MYMYVYVWVHAWFSSGTVLNKKGGRREILSPDCERSLQKGWHQSARTLFRHFSLTFKDYEKAYADGHTCNTVDNRVKEYKSHLGVYK